MKVTTNLTEALTEAPRKWKRGQSEVFKDKGIVVQWLPANQAWFVGFGRDPQTASRLRVISDPVELDDYLRVDLKLY